MKNRSHISSTFRHAIVYGGATILTKIISFTMLPIYAHCIGAEGYGMIGMIDMVISVATLMIGYGINTAMWRFYFQKETEEERKTLVSTTIIMMFMLVVGVSIPLLLLHKQIGYLALGSYDYGYYIIIAILAFVCEMTSRTAESYILIQQKPFLFSALAVFRMLLGLSLNIYLIVYRGMGVLGFLYSSLICSFVLSFINHSYTFSFVGIRFEKSMAKDSLRFSLPLIPGYIAMFFRGNVDRVIMRTFMGLAQVGTYEMLNKFVSLIGVMIVDPFSKSWDPKRLEICETPEGPDVIARMFTLQLSLMFFFGLILGLEIPLMLRILTPKEFWVSSGVAFLMVMARILSYSYYQLYFGLMYAKKTNKISRIQIISSVMDMGFNFLLIPRFGILGAVITSCITYSNQCCIAFFMSRGYYKIPFQWNKIIKISIVIILLFIGIDQFSVEKLGIASYLNQEMAPAVTSSIKFLHLENVKNGKLMFYAVNNVSLLFEAIVKLILSMLFLLFLIFLNILPRRIINIKTLLQPRESISEISL
ncbi:MAG: polysaccharide biosynthesis protein [Desulfuromonadales bacterium]|nr:polysaccharide biosynthesis protein [Desulfuromonadales bacterium]